MSFNWRQCFFSLYPREQHLITLFLFSFFALCRILKLVEKHSLGDASRWRQTWETVWQDNLDRCRNGMCKVKLS